MHSHEEVFLALLDNALGHRSEANLGMLQEAADELRPKVLAQIAQDTQAATKEAELEQAAADEAIAQVRAKFAAEAKAAADAKAKVKAAAPPPPATPAPAGGVSNASN